MMGSYHLKFEIGRPVGVLLCLSVAACSPLRVFDAVVPKDGGTRLVVRDAAFGPDPRQRLDIYAPRAPSATPRPIILFFYGGSWSSGTKSGYSFVGRAFASRGFVVAIPDYRLVPQVRYPAFLNDNAAAVRWVRSHAAALGGDPDKLVLMGHSAGAYDAAMLSLDARWLGTDRRAIKAFVGLAGPYDFLPLSGPILQQTFGAVADPIGTQPIHYVAPGDPAAFLATGEEDRTVRPANSDALATKLRAVGVTVERRRYPHVGHVGLVTAIAVPLRKRASILDDVSAFVRRAIGSAPE